MKKSKIIAAVIIGLLLAAVFVSCEINTYECSECGSWDDDSNSDSCCNSKSHQQKQKQKEQPKGCGCNSAA